MVTELLNELRAFSSAIGRQNGRDKNFGFVSHRKSLSEMVSAGQMYVSAGHFHLAPKEKPVTENDSFTKNIFGV